MKILAIASAGGHWIQLLRLMPSFEGNELTFVSTKKSFSETVLGNEFFSVPDASRWNKFRLLHMSFCMVRIVFQTKPDVVITTGAAPGLIGLASGKILGAKTIWIDSIANVEKLSLSGRLAFFFADRVYTQWKHLETSKVFFNGNVL